MIKFNCDNCGKEVERKEVLYKRSKTHCCSSECAGKLKSANHKSVFSREFTSLEPITQRELMDLFEYDSLSGEFFIKKKYNTLYNVGDSPKTVNKDGYYQLRINNKMYTQHRLAWLYVYGEFPDGDIDHVNHNRMDNRIENLRVVSRAENNRNIKKRGNNTSGTNGVWWNCQNNKWIAEGARDGVKHYLGSFDCIVEAAKVRKQFDEEFDFHENHGK